VAHVSYPGLESFAQHELARQQLTDYRGNFAPGSMLYFSLQNDQDGENKSGEAFIDYIADHAYTITLAVSLGQIRTLIENPYAMTHAALPEEEKQARGVEPGGMRLSVGLEDWHDIIADLEEALDQVSATA
jgi:cystathionine beta-lyase/cystathionine gamma-synthase